MFLLEPGETTYDLKWRMFGVDVRVHPMFWLLSAIMGFNFLQIGFEPFFVWIACVFFSILVHEFGHVFMFRVCGAPAHVVLYAFGGLAVPHRRLYNRWQRIAVSFAGPFAGFLIVVAIAVWLAVTDREGLTAVYENLLGIQHGSNAVLDLPPLAALAVSCLIWINLFWGLLNLLPIYPLDGGHISRDFLDGIMPGGKGVRVALIVSLVVAGVLTVHSIASARGYHLIPFLPSFGSFSAIMFAMLAMQSYQLLQQQQSYPRWRRRRLTALQ